MEIKEKNLHILLSHFYYYYFVDYLEEILADEKDEFSTIILLQGIDYFFNFCKENNVDIPFTDFKSYLKQKYVDWQEIYQYIMDRYKRECESCGENLDHTFEDTNNRIEF